MTDVMSTTPTGQTPAYVAAPVGAGSWPGVVVHDFTGMSHDLRNQADWRASDGFLAASPAATWQPDGWESS
jgi:carboxymethylenebutenolidase